MGRVRTGGGAGSKSLLLAVGLVACNGLTGASELSTQSAASFDGGVPPSTGATSPPTGRPELPSSPPPAQPLIDAATDSPPLSPDSGTGMTWTTGTFTVANHFGTCQGAKYVAHNDRYDLYVGVILCSPTRYKIYLGPTPTGTFYEIGDGSNGGEDHCEFVRPSFTLTNSGDITSGNCPTCALDYAGNEIGTGLAAYGRNNLGEPPVFYRSWPPNYYTSHWYECGVSIP